MSRIPVRFFVEQLRDSQRIVLTGIVWLLLLSNNQDCIVHTVCFTLKGFSFGALLAISMMARIWKNTYNSEEVLRKHIVCIAFGAPLINLPPVNQVHQEVSKMESVIHLVFLKDDLIPRLLRFTNFEPSFSAPIQQSSSLLALPSGNAMKVCSHKWRLIALHSFLVSIVFAWICLNVSLLLIMHP